MAYSQLLLATVSLLVVVGCVDRPAPSATGSAAQAAAQAPEPAPEPETPALHPVVVELIDRLDEKGHTMSMTGDVVTSPESFVSLVEMGTEALPTILRVAETTEDLWTRDLLISIAGRIGDARARPLLVRFLQSSRSNSRSEAITALGRLGGAASLPPLRALLDGKAAVDGFTRLQVLEAIYRCGDQGAMGEILAIGLRDETNRFSAARILIRHQPLRDALGFDGPFEAGRFEMIDEDTFFPAADEWYREKVLGEPSPWRATELGDFAPPFQKEKRAAWAVLWKWCARRDGRYSRLRVTAVDPAITEADARRAVTVISGSGHGHGLTVTAWRAESGGGVRGHRFVFRRSEQRSTFPEDQGTTTYSTVAIAASDYTALVAGLRTPMEANLVRWWAGPRMGMSMSSANFVVSLEGLGEPGDPAVAFCGYAGSRHRVKYLRPRAAVIWMEGFIAKRAPFTEAEPGPDAKALFSAIFRRSQAQWGGTKDSWWWVRERMVSLAAAAGDDSLREPLAIYLGPKYTEGEHSVSRTAAKACTALAAITRQDLRFAADGTPSELRGVAKAYQALLERK
jgi:hypothetical protein